MNPSKRSVKRHMLTMDCLPIIIYTLLSMLIMEVPGCRALNNGLVLTPPMGFLSWQRFRCETDCETYPDACINEKLYMEMADRLVADGYKDLGYEYVNIDDCWMATERDDNDRLQPDPDRFPHGIKYLADYIHSKGLKFGIYEDYGNFTCAGYPGILGHMETDAQTFAKWGVDFLKLDGCNAEIASMDSGYPEMGRYLNETGRPMVYSCSWPAYVVDLNITKPNYTAIAEHCNLWRNYNDIEDSWHSVYSIFDYYGDNSDDLVSHAGPGHWNDPDMLIVGDFGLSLDQSKVQMALWAIMASPLFISADLRYISKEHKAILQNKGIIAVNQDPAGIQGRRIIQDYDNIDIWSRPILPIAEENFTSYALAFVNRNEGGSPRLVQYPLMDLELNCTNGYQVTNLFTNEDYGVLQPNDNITVTVNPVGVVLVRAEVRTPDQEQ